MATRNGTDGNDLIHGTQGNDTINGFAGDDTIFSNGGDDMIDAGDGDDKVILRDPSTTSGVFGGDGYDTLIVNGASDSQHTNGGYGFNLSHSSFERVLGGSGDDFFNGYIVTVDQTFFGRAGDDTLVGGRGDDILNGGTGDDDLRAYDGMDRLFGRSGRDVMLGGDGADRFIFAFQTDFGGTTAATCDRIRDFDSSENDAIMLHNLDADRTNAAGTNDDFTFIADTAFTGVAGELRYEFINGNTIVMGDWNGDADADFWILLDGEHTLTAGDFYL